MSPITSWISLSEEECPVTLKIPKRYDFSNDTDKYSIQWNLEGVILICSVITIGVTLNILLELNRVTSNARLFSQLRKIPMYKASATYILTILLMTVTVIATSFTAHFWTLGDFVMDLLIFAGILINFY